MISDNFETAIYYDRADAETAVERLRNLGYTEPDISVMSAEGMEDGALVSGGLGALATSVATMAGITAIASTGGLAAPFVVGPLAAIAGLSGGMATGNIVGELVEAGVPKGHAEFYAKGLTGGGVVLGVHAPPELFVEVRRVFANAERPDEQPI